MTVSQFVAGKLFRFGSEDEVTDLGDFLALFDSDINLTGGGVHPHLGRKLAKHVWQLALTKQTLDGIFQVGVGENCPTTDVSTIHSHSADVMLSGLLLRNYVFHETFPSQVRSVRSQLLDHILDQSVRTTLESVDAFAHEIGEYDPVGNCGILECRTIGKGDGLEQQALYIVSTGKELLEQVSNGATVGHEIIHRADMLEKIFHPILSHHELVLQDTSKVPAVESRPQIVLRINEANVLQLNNGIRNLLRPVLATRLDHAHGETMQGNVKDVPPGPFEPSSQASELVVVFKKQNRVTLLGQTICTRKPPQTTTDDDDVVEVVHTVQRILCHKPTSK